jgi:hydrogenase maturation protein HypF
VSGVVRLRLAIAGVVQGVGFRPFIYRLAMELGLRGWVRNGGVGVVIEVEGSEEVLRGLRGRIEAGVPTGCHLQSVEGVWLDAVGHDGFEIRASEEDEGGVSWVRPDVATCPECVAEIFEPSNRRYQYPFSNCALCGPRYSIIESLPYDRERTSMRRFSMCAACREEYEDPLDRRFHAQPIACPRCGPRLEFWHGDGRRAFSGVSAMEAAVDAIRAGAIVAVKGLGGFQLVVDARSEEAVTRLRARKHREEKPFALMFPSLGSVGEACEVSETEGCLLTGPEAPIVLLRRRQDSGLELAEGLAPGNPYLGVMLPYTPLHHLMMRALGFPVVATSGNVSDEPMCVDEAEALEQLGGVADYYLVHDRPVVRRVDDSIVRMVAGREMVLRRARGYAPFPVSVPVLGSGERGEGAMGDNGVVLAVGAQLKSVVGVGVGGNVFLSQHIGDLESASALGTFRQMCEALPRLFGAAPGLVTSDLHPDYLSTKEARQMGLPWRGVQHHYAHVLGCMAENELEGPVLGIAWDGSGWGSDGSVWGGEFLVARPRSFKRFATLRQFPLPGGERAVREPRRAALGVLWELFGEAVFSMREVPVIGGIERLELDALRVALMRGLNAPRTSSMGRLFDAVAALVGMRQRLAFEGQAAMELEWAVPAWSSQEVYEMAYTRTGLGAAERADDEPGWRIDWGPMIRGVMNDVKAGVGADVISARFHWSLVELVVGMAERSGLERVVLTGGCFQNRVLLEGAIERLRGAGFRVYWPQRVPANDGGIALGQAVAGLWGSDGAGGEGVGGVEG